MNPLLAEIRSCVVCKAFLKPNPILAFSKESRILVIGQAPGFAAHQSSVPWNDKSGDNLRNWMGIDRNLFYNPQLIAIMPMGLCYPGTGKSGDLPPRPECAPLWHQRILHYLQHIELILLVGQYAQAYYINDRNKSNLTKTVQRYKDYLPRYFVLPHPSPRNNIWMAKNPWFAANVLPDLKTRVQQVLNSP